MPEHTLAHGASDRFGRCEHSIRKSPKWLVELGSELASNNAPLGFLLRTERPGRHFFQRIPVSFDLDATQPRVILTPTPTNPPSPAVNSGSARCPVFNRFIFISETRATATGNFWSSCASAIER